MFVYDFLAANETTKAPGLTRNLGLREWQITASTLKNRSNHFLGHETYTFYKYSMTVNTVRRMDSAHQSN